MREAIRTRNYIMTLHAEEEMDDDDLSIFDIERIILTGTIIEQQKDQVTEEWKYLIEGDSISKELAVVVAKISITGKLVIITVYKI
ncbi:MAG: DUF4258 domain-containing protein [Candidatus Electrothrix sp. MAN1_4]|nr:DUF4258 domain-containing protein [Candidatus Electrothrix sp. MAN1_4]